LHRNNAAFGSHGENELVQAEQRDCIQNKRGYWK